ncbi:putative transcription factor B3-Domain family [Helianthus annuus]|nr:putative transcription factor B3-Domain family [Helianthus annuus]
MTSFSAAPKVCFNSTCNQVLEAPRRGWLCRTGAFADLCDRCALGVFLVLVCYAFENGKFCDTYHLNASGWRCCESCGKQIHCGCIVSFHMFILLDAGGIECLKCAKTEDILTPNPTWPSASNFLQGPAERISGSNSWRSIAGSGPVPWQQAPSLFNAFKGQPELQLTSCSLGRSTRDDPSERYVTDSWRISAQELISDKAASGIQYDGKHNLFKDVSYQSFFHTNDTPLSTLPATFALHNQKIETENVSGIRVKGLCTPQPVAKQCSTNDGVGPSLGNQSHNSKARDETQSCNQLLSRYWPQLTDQELQQLPAGSNAKITPLFEKVLSPSDAGKIGRLVLPKKCAEAYLPPISQPEGCPLVIQDSNGKDWVLQYRFWPNGNSRMYFLEGVASCIQSMQLQAGDTVTFSRLDPEEKLVMGFRKASSASPSDKGNGTDNTNILACEESSKDCRWSEVDKTSIHAKRKKGAKMYSNNKTLRFSVTLEQVQGLLRPPLTNAPTIVLFEGVEFEVFQEAPVIGSPTAFSQDNVGSLCSTEVEPTPKHPDHMLPAIINHENSESLPNTTKHKSTCTCNICLSVNRFTPPPMMHRDLIHPEQQVGTSLQNPTQLRYADVICYTQTENGNDSRRAWPSQRYENDPSREQSSSVTFKNQNIDLNIQPEREEETYPVSDMGIMRLVQESTQRYMKQQKLLINDTSHKNHGI